MVKYSKIKIVSEVGVKRLHIQGGSRSQPKSLQWITNISSKKRNKKKELKMEIYNLLSCGIKYDIDDFESFLFENNFTTCSQKFNLLDSYHTVLVAAILTIVVVHTLWSKWKKFDKKKGPSWFFELNRNQQRLLIFCVYLAAFLCFYSLGHINIVDQLYLKFYRSILPIIYAGQDNQNNQKSQKAKGKEKMATTPAEDLAEDPNEASNSWKASTNRDDSFTDDLARADRDTGVNKRCADDLEESSSGDQPFMPDLDRAVRDENISIRIKMLKIRSRPAKQRLSVVSPIDPNQQVQPAVANDQQVQPAVANDQQVQPAVANDQQVQPIVVNYEILGDSAKDAGKRFAELFTCKAVKEMQDRKRQKRG